MLEANTGVKVLEHPTKKPGCKDEVMAYFRAHPDSGVTRPDQIAIVGDRLSTDIMMANMMGSYGFWIKDGAVRPGFVSWHALYVIPRLITSSLQGWRIDCRAFCSGGVTLHQTHRATIILNDGRDLHSEMFCMFICKTIEVETLHSLWRRGLQFGSRYLLARRHMQFISHV